MNWINLLPLIMSAYHNRTTPNKITEYCLPNKNKKQHYSQKDLKRIYNEYKKGKYYGM